MAGNSDFLYVESAGVLLGALDGFSNYVDWTTSEGAFENLAVDAQNVTNSHIQ
jgi:hypothetical protein